MEDELDQQQEPDDPEAQEEDSWNAFLEWYLKQPRDVSDDEVAEWYEQSGNDGYI